MESIVWAPLPNGIFNTYPAEFPFLAEQRNSPLLTSA